MPINIHEQPADISNLATSSGSSLIPCFTLDDLILPNSTFQEIQDFISYQENKDTIYNSWGLAKTHKYQKQLAINLYGEPGTGKTMAAQAIAYSLKKPITFIDYSSIESKYVGETSKNITNIFDKATKEDAIIFFDEADALLSRRVNNMSSSTDVSVNQTRSVLLNLMDRHQGIVIFTTNFIENYDIAFMRRISTHILFELPDIDNRKSLWGKYIPKELPVSNKVTVSNLAEISEGLSGSDIANIVLKVAISASREKRKEISLEHFIKAVDQTNKSKSANSKNNVSFESNTIDNTHIEVLKKI